VPEVLNPTLYGSLVRRYGQDGVEVVSPGEGIDWSVRRARPGESSGWKREVENSGEEYRLRCPFCKDHRARLYVNHRFGIWDEQTQSFNLWLAQCFNESCFSDYENQEIFCDWTYSIPVARRKTVRLTSEGKKISGRISEIAPPGPMWRLDELAKSHPNHHAVEYLASRHFDPVKMGKLWGAAYCPKAHVYSMATDRIIIPIHWNGKMVGWQARYIGDDVRGVPFNVAGVAKYWSSPGFKRSRVAYNFHRAVQHPTVIVVEGMTDVWSMGVQSTGVFGKTMGAPLRRDLLAAMSKHDPEEAVIVLLLDPKKDKKDKVHHIERLYQQLVNEGAPVRVLKVYLPLEVDPGSSERVWLRRYVQEKGDAVGIPVSFRKPRR